MHDSSTGYWAIRFFDMHGEDWVTKPIPAGASCAEVIDALNSLPNEVIPEMMDNLCTRVTNTGRDKAYWMGSSSDDTSLVPGTSEIRPIEPPLQFSNAGTEYFAGDVYRVQFYNNPGKLRQPEIETMLDGGRTTLAAGDLNADGSQKTIHQVKTAVWTDGQQGENIDYFGDHCDGVSVTIGTEANTQILASLTTTERQLLKACLGGSDDVDSNNIGIFDWDEGSDDYPHLLKLVLTTTSQSDGGYYIAVIHDDEITAAEEFRLLNPFDNLDNQAQNEYEVYTTQGVLARTSKFTEASVVFGSKQIITTNTTADVGIMTGAGTVDTTVFGSEMTANGRFTGDLSCENNDADSFFVSYCVNKTDILIPLSVTGTSTAKGCNPSHINMYTVDRIGQTERLLTNAVATDDGMVMDQGTNYIDLDMSVNFYREANSQNFAPVYVYKFFPNDDSNYEYVAQCSNRGLCNNEEGLCECFAGYTGDACQIQASLAV
jgi:hypothetical protein